MNTPIIYFQFKDFHVPFMTLQILVLNFLLKQREEVVFLVFQVLLVLTPQATLSDVLGDVIGRIKFGISSPAGIGINNV